MIRKIQKSDEQIFYKMAEMFYASDAVLHPIPKEHHANAFMEMMLSDQYIEGYIFEYEGEPAGYAITSKMYSQEAGGITLWIDELFVLKEFRSKGLGKQFFQYLKNSLSPTITRLRLEVEEENEGAVKLYEKLGFSKLEYNQMYLEVQSTAFKK